MKALRSTTFLLFVCSALVGTIGHASEEDPAVYLQKELRIELSTFGQGIAEAIRGMGKRAVPGKETEYVVHSEQVGTGYRIKWITKKSVPDAPFPEYMKLAKSGTILPGNTILGKTNQSEIISRFGKPHTQSSGTMSFHLPGYQGDDTATFTFRNGKVVTVEWHWFVD